MGERIDEQRREEIKRDREFFKEMRERAARRKAPFRQGGLRVERRKVRVKIK